MHRLANLGASSTARFCGGGVLATSNEGTHLTDPITCVRLDCPAGGGVVEPVRYTTYPLSELLGSAD